MTIGQNRQLQVFAHLTAEKATLYRAIMRVLMAAKARFRLHIRPAEIIEELRLPPSEPEVDEEEVARALNQLCTWGNVVAHQDTADVRSVEVFLSLRLLYQITHVGEAAERAITGFFEHLSQQGELQTTALRDIIAVLRELVALAEETPADEGKAHRALKGLWDHFDSLTSRAQTFISTLQQRIDLQEFDHTSFAGYKETLIEYLERFLRQLVAFTAEIADLLGQLEGVGIENFLNMAAQRDISDAVEKSQEKIEASQQQWCQRWQGLWAWFVSTSHAPSQAEELRRYARKAIPELLRIVETINERRTAHSDRAADFRTLARWFAETDSDRDAHRLFRAAFGISPSRHMRANMEHIEFEYDAAARPPSWLEAPPIHIRPRYRKTGRTRSTPRSRLVIDRSEEKAKIAELTRQQTEELRQVQGRLATNGRLRLSELGALGLNEFHLFLDLLGEALTRKKNDLSPARALSSDGTMRIELVPIQGNRVAVVETSIGRFSGPDHFVTIEAGR